MAEDIIRLNIPISSEAVKGLSPGDKVLISGKILCGRDAVLPKLVKLAESNDNFVFGTDLEGAVVFHTAVSVAGVGPTSSNKIEIESSIEPLSKAGVRLHLGKGALKASTVQALEDNGAVFAVIPPLTALLKSKTKSQRVMAFSELGMEALYELEVDEFPAIIAAAQGKTIYK